jgi:prefoldin subunit 5
MHHAAEARGSNIERRGRMDEEEVKQKLEEYTRFMNDVLRPDYVACQQAENEVRMEIDEYEDLRKLLTNLQIAANDAAGETTVNTLTAVEVDLGHQKVFCQATVHDASLVMVHVGLGFYAELSIAEALSFAEKRVTFLRDSVLIHRSVKSNQVREHIKQSEMILDQLSSELQRM